MDTVAVSLWLRRVGGRELPKHGFARLSSPHPSCKTYYHLQTFTPQSHRERSRRSCCGVQRNRHAPTRSQPSANSFTSGAEFPKRLPRRATRLHIPNSAESLVVSTICRSRGHKGTFRSRPGIDPRSNKCRTRMLREDWGEHAVTHGCSAMKRTKGFNRILPQG